MILERYEEEFKEQYRALMENKEFHPETNSNVRSKLARKELREEYARKAVSSHYPMPLIVFLAWERQFD